MEEYWDIVTYEYDFTENGIPTFTVVDDALHRLAALDERKSRIVELKFFGGLSAEETAQVIGVAPVTVMREWGKAKAWLYRELSK